MNINNILKCSFCDYTSCRKYNLKRHEINIHSKEILNENKNVNQIENQNLNQNENQNVNDKDNIQINKEKQINNSKETMSYNIDNLYCSKCCKKYKTKKNLLIHEEKCIGIDVLTCDKCMFSFSNKQSKSRHLKNNNCIAKSIIYARQPNIQNIETLNNITNIDNSITNNDNRIINNTFVINNYGNERLDYLSEEDMMTILTSGKNTIPLYIEKKHFNKEFPENHNIRYDNKSKRCRIKENNTWKNMNLSMVSSKLINDNSSALLLYFNNNKELLNKKIKNEDIYDFIIEKLLYIKNKSDKEKYNNLFNIIKFLIEGSNKLLQ